MSQQQNDFDFTDASLFRVRITVDDWMPNTEVAQQMVDFLGGVFQNSDDKGRNASNTLENTARNVLAALIIRAVPEEQACLIPPLALHTLTQDAMFTLLYAAIGRWLALEADIPRGFPVPQESLETHLRRRFDDETWKAFLENPKLDQWRLEISIRGDDLNVAVWAEPEGGK